MQNISLKDKWLELQAIPIETYQENQSLTIGDFIEWRECANGWQSMLCKFKMAWIGKGWLDSSTADALFQKISGQKLETICALIGKIQQSCQVDMDAMDETIQVLNRIELLDLITRNEKLRREQNAEKMLIFFDPLAVEDFMQTALFADFITNSDQFGKVIDSRSIKKSFFTFLKEQLVYDKLDQDKFSEFNKLLKKSDRIIYEIVKHEYNRLLMVERAVYTYRLLLKSRIVPRESEKLTENLFEAFETLLNSIQEFYGLLFDTVQKENRINELAKLFQSQAYRSYTDALSGVTRLYFKFLKHEDLLRTSLAHIEINSPGMLTNWEEGLAPLTYFKVVPAHRSQLEKLLEMDVRYPELEVSIEAVYDIQARWFNH